MVLHAQEAPISPEEIAHALAEAALEKKAHDLAILDMRGLIDYADVFVIVSASNRRQVQAIAEEVRMQAKQELGLIATGVEGLSAARWVLVDFGDVVVHVFDQPLRGFYDLDGLWSDAPRLPLPEGAEQEDEAIMRHLGEHEIRPQRQQPCRATSEHEGDTAACGRVLDRDERQHDGDEGDGGDGARQVGRDDEPVRHGEGIAHP